MKLGIIGTGNMGAALLKGIAGGGAISPSDIGIFDADIAKAAAMQTETGVVLYGSCAELTKKSDYIILAVKPGYVAPVLTDIKDSLSSDKILISIAVGISIKYMASFLNPGSKIIRTMPNTPASVFEGMTVLSFPPDISQEEKLVVTKLFSYVGKTCELPESLMSEVTALTGSSPAYVYIFIEAMADAAVLSGIPRDIAYKLAAQAVLGSAKMVLESSKHPAELKDQVCSPAGTTVAAVAALEENGFRKAVFAAMDACTARAKEIGNT